MTILHINPDKYMLTNIFNKLNTVGLIASCWFDAMKTRNYCTYIINNTKNIKDVSIVLILVIKNEADRIPYFIDYYRSLGVEHFLILDNNSDDGLHDLLINQDDVSLVKIRQNYNASRYGVNWINYFARKYCIGKWVLSVDIDEFLVYPKSTTRDVKQLCKHLTDIGVDKMFTPMVDMYSNKSVEESVYSRGDNPLDVCKYFDGSGYFSVAGGMGGLWTRGGVRMRVFNTENPLVSPALNKFTLLKWNHWMFYYVGAHTLLPKRKNKELNPNVISGALLHFKFFSDLYDKSSNAVKTGNHYNDSSEYKKYIEDIELLKKPLLYSGSIKYESINNLIDAGLVNTGEWY